MEEAANADSDAMIEVDRRARDVVGACALARFRRFRRRDGSAAVDTGIDQFDKHRRADTCGRERVTNMYEYD